MAGKLILCRHGQSDWNRKNLFTGWQDVDLTEKGIEEAVDAGSLIGQKFVINEFYAYASFVQVRDTLSPHTQVVVTFALCGFANLAAIAILLGGLGSVVPSRRRDIARLGLRAVIGGTLVNLTSASLAGFFFSLQ